jgi:two-component system, LytTR family, sensor kinase
MPSKGYLYNNKIGFDDRKLMLLIIPFFACMIPFVFFGLRLQREPYIQYKMFITTFVITICVWFGNRYILILSRTKYPLFVETKTRIKYQTVMMFFFTVLATNLLGYIFRGYCDFLDDNLPGRTLNDLLFNSNSSSIFCTLTIVAIYESRYFMSQLKQSVEEKELLKRESLMAQLIALKTQVNPHFLFNNLNTLCSIIPDQPNQAVEFVQELSKVYRHILDVKDETLIPLKDELEVLKAYAFLLKTRFGDNLEIDIQVSEESLQNSIVPLSLQLLMENAIKHNIVSQNKPLKIIVQVNNGNLIVSNNLQKKNQVHESTGIGLNNIRNRYKLMTNLPISITEIAGQFTVSIPLIAN